MSLRRRDFITLLGGAAAWPLAARAQQQSPPVVAFINGSTADPEPATAFRKGLSEAGSVDGQNVAVEYHWLEGQYDRLPALMADVVRRRVSVIATPGFLPGTLAARTATATIPIVFAVTEDPVKLGLVASLARPGGNATGVNFLLGELAGKRLALLQQLVPKAARIALLVNPENAPQGTLKEVETAARALGLQISAHEARSISEIDAAFAASGREQADALFAFGDGFFHGRRVQIATSAIRYRLPTSFTTREYVEAGGLMSYGTNLADTFRQAGIYAGSILKGANPADLPVAQSSKFVFTLNQQTARLLGIDLPPSLLAIADEVIE